jgi:hypothetical protein
VSAELRLFQNTWGIAGQLTFNFVNFMLASSAAGPQLGPFHINMEHCWVTTGDLAVQLRLTGHKETLKNIHFAHEDFEQILSNFTTGT